MIVSLSSIYLPAGASFVSVFVTNKKKVRCNEKEDHNIILIYMSINIIILHMHGTLMSFRKLYNNNV